MVFIISLLYAAIPIGSVIFFVVSLILYIQAKKKYDDQPCFANAQILKNRKIMLIVSSILFGVFLIILIGFIILLTMAVAFM